MVWLKVLWLQHNNKQKAGCGRMENNMSVELKQFEEKMKKSVENLAND